MGTKSLLKTLFILALLTCGLQAAKLTQNIGSIKSGTLLFKANNGQVEKALTLDTNVDIDIVGSIARVKVTQKFKNPTDLFTEGVYVFPLPDDAAVDQMSMKVGSRVVVGEIKEKKEAKKIYEKAKSEGKVTSLVEQERVNVFTTSVANIEPKATVEITIEYQQSVNQKDEKFSIRFPMVVNERYTPKPKEDTSRLTNTYNKNSYQPINPVILDIDMKLGYVAKNINSLYHSIDIKEVNKKEYKVEFSSQEYASRDFVLEWEEKSGVMPQATFYTQKVNESEIYGLLMVAPPKKESLKSDVLPREVIFVIDSSGSMYGSSMHQAREALRLALQTLKSTDRFNIIDFDDRFMPLFKGAVEANSDNIKKANDFITTLIAQGGTDAYPALEFALDSIDSQSQNYIRQVIFLTDGSIGNERDMFELIQTKLGSSRLFTVGIGAAPNSYFMKKSSEHGRGTYLYIGDVSEVQEKMKKLFSKLTSPILTDIKINMPSWIHARYAPKVIPDLYDKEQIVVAMKLDRLPKTDITITGKLGNDDWSAKLAIEHVTNTKGIEVLWAKKKVDDYMKILVNTYDDETKENIKQVVTQLGLQHHIVTKYTSLVAVDKTPVRTQTMELKSSKLKLNRPTGWDKPKTKTVKAPKTATSSRLYMILGLMMLVSLWLLREKKGAYNV